MGATIRVLQRCSLILCRVQALMFCAFLGIFWLDEECILNPDTTPTGTLETKSVHRQGITAMLLTSYAVPAPPQRQLAHCCHSPTNRPIHQKKLCCDLILFRQAFSINLCFVEVSHELAGISNTLSGFRWYCSHGALVGAKKRIDMRFTREVSQPRKKRILSDTCCGTT